MHPLLAGRAMRRLGLGCAVVGVSLSVGVTASNPQGQAGFLWIAESQGLLNVATDSAEVRFEKTNPGGFSAVAVNDVNGDVWAFQFPDLYSFDRFGNARSHSTPPLLASPGTADPAWPAGMPTDMVVDGISGNLWLAVGPDLYRFDMSGTLQGRISLPDLLLDVQGEPVIQVGVAPPAATFIAISLDRARSRLWAATRNSLWLFAADGALLSRRDVFGEPFLSQYILQDVDTNPVPNASISIEDIAHDAYHDALWLARSDKIQRLSQSGVSTVATTQLKSISSDGAGGIWFAAYGEPLVSWTGQLGGVGLHPAPNGVGDPLVERLGHLDANGQIGPTLTPFPSPLCLEGLCERGDAIVDHVADAKDASVWVASTTQLKHFAIDGAHLATVDVQPSNGEIRKIARSALYTDLDVPEIAITSPADGSQTSDNTPVFALSYFDLGVGIDQASLKFKVDGATTAFSCSTTPTSATCTPAAGLADGLRTIAATIADQVGNVSAEASRTITIDTIAPAITITSPANGVFTSQAAVTIQGSVSEPASLTINGVSVTLGAANTFTHEVSLAEGANAFELKATDLVGNQGTAHLTVNRDSILPVVTISSPADGLVTNVASLAISGSVSEPASLTINGASVPLNAANEFSHAVTLAEGGNSFGLLALDAAGNQGTASLQVTLDTGVPAVPQTALITVGVVVDGAVTVAGAAGSVEGGSQVRIRNTRTGQVVTVTAAANGSFTASIAAAPGDGLEITQSDSAGNTSSALARSVTVPDPANTAPPLNRNEFTPLLESVSFLYTGPNAVQLGVTGTFIPELVAVLRGRVLDSTGAGLIAVRISAKDHPEWGYTYTRADGAFDFVVNGGGSVFLDFTRSDALPVQRQVEVPWRQYQMVDDVVMTRLDSAVTQVALGAGSPVQLAESSMTTDAAGTREVAVLFPSNTTATMTLADGTTAPLNDLSVRATEYTVGANGPKAMPGILPGTSAYTYAVELSVDQALQAGATTVTFSKNLPVYVDNFLNFPVGEDVPAGYYDRARGQWVPSQDGRIVKVLSEDAVQGAVLDVTGSGTPSSAAQLSELGITVEERQALAARYDAGAVFWRIPVKHFTPWDFNWPWSLPDGAGAPPTSEPAQPTVPESRYCPECPGSVIDSKAQSLGEDLSLTGVASGLHYRSDRLPAGRSQSRTVIKLTEGNVHLLLQSIQLDIEIAGRRFQQSFARAPNLSHTFTWDGRDAYGRELSGTHEAKITVAYVYPAVFRSSRSGFAQSFGSASAGGIAIGANRALRNISVTRKWSVMMSGARPVGVSAGGWSLTRHHQYDPGARTLYRGDGSRVSTAMLGAVIRRIAGGGSNPAYDIPATQSNRAFSNRVAMSPTGELHVRMINNDLAKIDRQGFLRLVKAGLQYQPEAMDFGPDGRLYLASQHRIHRLEADGSLTLIAGSGATSPAGDGGQAVNAGFGHLFDIDVAADGSIYLVDGQWSGGIVLRITPSGILNSLVGGSASRVVALDDGSILWSSGWNGGVSRYTARGENLAYLPGNGTTNNGGDGGPVSSAKGGLVTNMARTKDGVVILNDFGYYRAVTPDDIINTIAGGGAVDAAQASGGPALEVTGLSTSNFALGDDGRIYTQVGGTGPSPGLAEIRLRPVDFAQAFFQIPSQDGSELYEFSAAGRHLRTLDAFTGAVLYQFSYNSAGQLVTMLDVDGDATTIERDGTGNPTAIVGPDGHRTTLTVNEEGYLTSVTDPAGNAYVMTYYPGGLLHTYRDPRANTATYTYDPATGRLTQDVDRAGGGWTLGSTVSGLLTTNTMTSAGGRTSQFKVLRIPRHAGPRFRRMSVHRSAASRSSIPRHVGPVGDAG